jgi:hypothetical protein
MLAPKGGISLDDMVGIRCSWESEQTKNLAGGMVPLYDARVQDLGPAITSSSNAARADTWPKSRQAG